MTERLTRLGESDFLVLSTCLCCAVPSASLSGGVVCVCVVVVVLVCHCTRARALDTQHDALVTDIDWAPNTDRILSCSQDRNAYVWNKSSADGEWKPELVLLRSNRAATCCK